MPGDQVSDAPIKFKIGILEVQGAFLEHKVALEAAAKELGENRSFDVIGVRHASHITPDMRGLIIPGGESTAISLFLSRNDMDGPLKTWSEDKSHVTWGTCAGMILLSKLTENQKKDGQVSLNRLDTVVSRNFFGRQVKSFEADLEISHPDLKSDTSTEKDYFHGVFIRAPAVLKTTHPSVEVLATLKAEDSGNKVIVACRQGNVLATAFHPELTEDVRWHRYFLRMIEENSK